MEAYLDIETTGLSPSDCTLTVIGIHTCNSDDGNLIQLVGKDITKDSLLEALKGVDIIYTYNGQRFDLPFIHYCLEINLAEIFKHHDLMYDCWERNLYGGFKAVERQLGIGRKLIGMDGYQAVRMWWRYVESFDLDALDMLLQYNKEDVLNLKMLREMLEAGTLSSD